MHELIRLPTVFFNRPGFRCTLGPPVSSVRFLVRTLFTGQVVFRRFWRFKVRRRGDRNGLAGRQSGGSGWVRVREKTRPKIPAVCASRTNIFYIARHYNEFKKTAWHRPYIMYTQSRRRFFFFFFYIYAT